MAEEAEKIGFPVLIKAVLGGGGKVYLFLFIYFYLFISIYLFLLLFLFLNVGKSQGMRIVENMDQLKEAIDLAQREGINVDKRKKNDSLIKNQKIIHIHQIKKKRT